MRAVAGVLIVLLAATGCNSSKLTSSGLIAKNIRKEFGPFDETEWTADSLEVSYTYYGKDLERGKRIKRIIDKSLDQEGIEHEVSEGVEKIIGFKTYYFWGTPTARVELYPLYFNIHSDRLKLFITRRINQTPDGATGKLH